LFITTNVYACGELKSLVVAGAKVEKTGDASYVVTVKKGTSTVKLVAESDYPFEEGYGPREVSTNSEVELKVNGNACGYGTYTYKISFKQESTIIAENTQTTATTQPVVEEPAPTPVQESSKPTLENIVIEDVEFTFSKDTLDYSIEVDEDVTELNITAKPTEEGDTVSISENIKELTDGVNKIIITVTNPVGETTTYTINVTKTKSLSDNNYLASLKVTGYTLNFDAEEENYTLKIGNDSYLGIVAEAQSKNATVDIKGNENLKNGSVITIEVTAEDGTTKDYTIKIQKDNFIIAFVKEYIVYLVVALLTLILLVLFIINSNKKKKNKAREVKPESVAAPATTAGVIQSQETPVQTPHTTAQPTQTTQNSTLQIIEPTNIETPQQNPQPTVQPTPEVSTNVSDETSTEIFKL